MDLILNSFNIGPIIFNESFGLCQFLEYPKSIHLGPNNYINYLNFKSKRSFFYVLDKLRVCLVEVFE